MSCIYGKKYRETDTGQYYLKVHMIHSHGIRMWMLTGVVDYGKFKAHFLALSLIFNAKFYSLIL